MVAYVADAELNAKARIAVRKIIHDDSLSSVAYWMDEVRRTPEGKAMKAWHYVGTRVCGSGQPWCPNEVCAVTKIEWARDLLRQPQGDDDVLLAIRVLTHLVGDLHQPLHAADNADFGGNQATITNRMCVEYGSTQPTACRLHTYWDTNLVKTAARGQSEQAAAAAWSAALGPLPAEDSDQPSDWARESWELAKATAYSFEGFACKVGKVKFAATDDYDDAGVSTVKQQIAKAGKRLARLLNATLGQ